MTDEIKEPIEAQEEAVDAAEQVDTTDWKAEARKWEKLAKKYVAAEKELAELQSVTDPAIEAARKRAEELEAQLDIERAEVERHKAAHMFARETGAPLEMLLLCGTADDMEAMAEAFRKQPRVHSVASKTGSRIVYDGPRATPGQVFADFMQDRFRL